MIAGFCGSKLHFVNYSLLFCIVLLLNQPLIVLVMYAIFLYGLEPSNI
jgi:hypothetical protein